MSIYHSTVYQYKSTEQYNEPDHCGNYIYQRVGDPTNENVEIILNEIEHGNGALLYNSGLSAIQAVIFEFLSAESHLIAVSPIYSGTFNTITGHLEKFGVEVTPINTKQPGSDSFVKAVKEASLKIIIHALSLGATGSLIEHPLTMTHSKEMKDKHAIIPEGLLRLSVGIANVTDLIADLDQALGKI